MNNLSRRQWVQLSAFASVAGTLRGSDLAEPAANEKLNLAVIGCAHRGGAIGSEAVRNRLTQCVAVCDVVPSRAEGFKKNMKGSCDEALVFDDFREMFEIGRAHV